MKTTVTVTDDQNAVLEALAKRMGMTPAETLSDGIQYYLALKKIFLDAGWRPPAAVNQEGIRGCPICDRAPMIQSDLFAGTDGTAHQFECSAENSTGPGRPPAHWVRVGGNTFEETRAAWNRRA